MQVEGSKSEGLALCARRVAAMVVAMGCHLVLLLGVLRPAAPRTEAAVTMESSDATLKVRFVQQRAASASLTLSALRSGMHTPVANRRVPAMEKLSPSASRSAHVAARSVEASTSIIPPNAYPSSAAPTPYASTQTPSEDGGFRDRMSDAQHSQGIRGVPGSDRRVVQGIQLTDPMNQGIGAVVRSAQRLFGVTNRHCIDVEVWQQLSPEELIARHLTEEDVKNESEKYECNRPKGLNF